ncbi:MAG: glycosyltransferase [Bacteroidota bacterium]
MDKKLTVAHVISDAGIGGAQVYVLQLLQRMKNDFRLLVICPKAGRYVEKYRKEATEVIGIDFQMAHLSLLETLRQLLKEYEVDVVHAHLMKGCIFSAFAAVGLKKKVFCSLHGDLAARNYQPLAFRLFSSLNYLAARTSVHYFCISAAERKQLSQQGVPDSKMSILYNAVDTQYFDYQPIVYQKGETLRVVFIGRLHPSKGILTLLHVAKRLPEVHFDIVGEGELRSTIEQAQATLKNIQLHPFQQDVRPFLEVAHLFVLPSNWEGFGMAIAEAMAAGRAVVSTNVGGIPELVKDGKGGFLCTPRDVEDLVAAIRRLQEKPELLQRFGTHNRKIIQQKFSLTVLTSRLRGYYLSEQS